MTEPVSTEVAIAVLQTDMRYVREAVDDIQATVNTIATEGLPRRVVELEKHDCDQDVAIEQLRKDQSDFKAEIRGALKVAKVVLTVVGFVSTIASLLLAAQALGVIR